MRIWDIPPSKLCRQHLLGEHRELHAIWSVLVNNKKGYSRHPETLRWKGKLAALYLRHGKLVLEMERRGYSHNSPLDRRLATGRRVQSDFVDPKGRQISLLKMKNCGCGKRFEARKASG
ncbi:MAG: pyrimidine dimer DNA glycosylase/endonuclease V [Candidatus Micrarchaeia archaeon]